MAADNQEDYWDDSYHQPFLWETNMAAVREEELRLANLAVQEAMELHRKQRFVVRAAKSVRSALYYVGFRLREKLALKLSKVICFFYPERDPNEVAMKLARKLGVW